MRDRESIFAENSFARGVYIAATCIYCAAAWAIFVVIALWFFHSVDQILRAFSHAS